MPSRRRIVVTTFGSLGDLHPYLAIGLGLRARGHDVTVATGESYRRKIEAAGLGFRGLRPDSDWIENPEMMRHLAHPRWGLLRVMRMLVRELRESYEDTLAAAENADLLVGNLATYATRLVAEKKGLPWASAMHIPIGFYSAHDPPVLSGFSTISGSLRFLGPAFWGPLGRFMKWAIRDLAEPWHRLRQQIGLPPIRRVNPLIDGSSSLLHLALFSKLLAEKQPDWPGQTLITGFPWYDHADGSASLPPALAHFLASGPPPIVFTLGSVIAADARDFFAQSAAAAKLLGHRAVLILKDPRNQVPALPPDVVAFEYAPFSELFPRAAAIIHHGGIGTTALAMRSGRPTLVMPCAWDQSDNAARAARLGLARIIPRRHYTAPRVAAELRHLLDDPSYLQHATTVARQLQREDGARVACDALEKLFPRVTSPNGPTP